VANGKKGHPGWYFVYNVLLISFLIYLALGNAAVPAWSRTAFPFEWPGYSFERVVPLWIPWGGALGGATISLVGVAKHAHDWNPARYRWWHLSRSFLGSVSGTFAVLLVVFVLQSVAPEVTDNGYDPKGIAVLTGIAFVVGYREETFRELIKRVVDLVLGPAPSAGGDTVAFVPDVVDFGQVSAEKEHPAAVYLFNSSADTIHVSTAALTPSVSNVSFSAEDANLPPQESWKLTVTWNPTTEKSLNQPFELSAGGRVIPLRVRGTVGP
jgi:hypothetical protein